MADNKEDYESAWIPDFSKSSRYFELDSEDTKQELLEEMEKFASSQQKKITEELNRRLSEIESKIGDQANRIESQNDKISDNRLRLIEALGLFVALFTFVSIQFQAFTNLASDRAFAAIFITGGIILLFVLVLDIMIRTTEELKKEHWFRFFLVLGLTIFMIATGVWLYNNSDESGSTKSDADSGKIEIDLDQNNFEPNTEAANPQE